HDHHDRMQEIHRRFGVEACNPRGRAGDIGEQNGRLLAFARHVGYVAVGLSRLAAPGAEPGRFREIAPAMGTYVSEGYATGRAEPARGFVLVCARPAPHRQSVVCWISSQSI